jgi:hypothetical protein
MSSNQLIGYWVIDSVREHAPEYYAEVCLHFTDDGLLQWGYEKPEKICVLTFQYVREADSIVTVLPPNPRKEHTPYHITHDGRLRLVYSGYETVWVRTTERAFFNSGARWEPDPTLIRPDYMASLQMPPSDWQRRVAEAKGVSPRLVVNTNALWDAWRYSQGTFSSFHLGDFEDILGRGVLPDWRSNEDSSLLMLVAAAGYKDAVTLLLDNGYDVNARDLFGATALDHAIHGNQRDVVELLLSCGAKHGNEVA